MALGGVFMTDTDGNIGQEVSNLSEKVCGLIFDISQQEGFWESGAGLDAAASLENTIIELNTLDDAIEAGIVPYESGTGSDVVIGIAYYHIKHFFQVIGGTGRLFVAFADCGTNWNIILDMQKAAHGLINQFGVWTERSLWQSSGGEQYSPLMIGELQSVGENLANSYNAPACILLSANTAKVKTLEEDELTVDWSKIPSCVVDARYVSVLLGQALDAEVTKMQVALTSVTPVGTVGAALGCLSRSNVATSIGWVQENDMVGCFPDIEFGFGDANLSSSKLTNSNRYDSLSPTQLDTLEELGYIFLVKYAGLEGHVYFSGDTTCSDGDYRTIARNRVINKSRRSVRTVLLPYVNSPLKVDPATGYLSTAQSTIFSNLVTDILQAMKDAEEISGFSVTIPANQNVLKNDTLKIQYSLIPIGTAKTINVTEGLAISQ